MPLKHRRKAHRKGRKGKKSHRPGRKMNPMRSLASQNIRKFKTTVDGGAITTSAGGVLYTQLYGVLTEIDNTAGNNFAGIGQQNALRSLYEEYRIDCVKFTFVPLTTVAQQGAATAGQVAYAVNRAPWSAVPTSMIDILRQNDCKVFNTTRGFSVSVRKPAWGDITSLDGQITANTLKNGTAETKHAYCSTRDYMGGQTQPYWYGMDLAINGFTGGVNCYRLYKTYYITFRNQT
nr:MAG: capsid protein [Cressdnaviricota sp.]